MHEVVISIGSNIEPQGNIKKALLVLKDFIQIEKVSGMITTKPIGITDQPDFVNGALKCLTFQSREELNQQLKAIEDRLGRDRSRPKFGPREIDLDIVAWNGEIVDTDYFSRDFLKTVVDQVI